MKNLFVPLKSKWYELFKSGEKTVEYRRYGPRWNEKTCTVGRRVILSKGYGKQNRLEGRIKKFWTEDLVNPNDLVAGRTACIEIENIRPWNGEL